MLQNFVGFVNRVAHPLRFPIHFREPLPDDGRLRIVRICLFIGFNRFGGVIRLACLLVLKFVKMSHRKVEISVGARRHFVAALIASGHKWIS